MRPEAFMQRKAIHMLIDSNPTSVTIDRESFVSEKGARKKVTSTVGPFDIAIYSNVIRTAPVSIQEMVDSVKLDKIEWTGLAKADADISSGGQVVDTFTVEGKGSFKVKTVVDIETMGIVTGKLLLLEMIR